MTTCIFIHIGAPRTGTTTLQKHVFPQLKNTYLYSKSAYDTSGIFSKQSPAIANKTDNHSPTFTRKDFSEISNNQDRTDFLRKYIINPSLYSSQENNNTITAQSPYKILSKAVELICNSDKNCLISSERLCDTSASLYCFSTHQGGVNRCLPIKPLCQAISENGGIPLINICLREPIQYLRSKYIRTCLLRREHLNQRELSAKEFIIKQANLEKSSPGTSALAQAMHSSFISQLHENAFVKAFGFRELLTTDDVFALMGISSEKAVDFRSLPQENSSKINQEIKNNIDYEIETSLRECGLYDRVQAEQLYE